MSPVEELVLVLLVIYALECLALARPKTQVVSGFIGRVRAPRRSGVTIGSRGSALFWLSPLPTTTTFISERLPFSLSDHGICVPAVYDDCPSEQFQAVPFTDLQKVRREGKDVILDGSLRIHTGSQTVARLTADLLGRLPELDAAKRDALMSDTLAHRFDGDAATERLATARRAIRTIGWLATALWLSVFVAVPVLGRYTHMPTTVWYLVAAILLLNTVTAVMYVRWNAKLSTAEKPARVGPLLFRLLVPTTTMRSAHALGRELLSAYEPMVVASVLGDKQLALDTARQAVREFNHPFGEPCDPDMFDHTAYDAAYHQATDEAAASLGLDAKELGPPDQAFSGQTQAWCERCGALFTDTGTTCSACGGRPVTPVESRPQPPDT